MQPGSQPRADRTRELERPKAATGEPQVMADLSRLSVGTIPVDVLPAIERNKGLLFVAAEDDPAATGLRETLQSLHVIDGEIELAVAKRPHDDRTAARAAAPQTVHRLEARCPDPRQRPPPRTASTAPPPESTQAPLFRYPTRSKSTGGDIETPRRSVDA
jgi:hypothetical protein